jgi:hypothetical protein
MGPGDLFAERFELVELAGAGGMGVVWRARDTVGGGEVALKLLIGRDERLVPRFLREGQLLASLSHPRVVRYVGHGATSDGRCWLALEWLEGEDLTHRLRRTGLSIAESVTLAERVAEALAYTHGRGVIHRDIKPSNIFLVGGQVAGAKLLDYGIAREGGYSEMTVAGVRVGTPAYMSPEQARGQPVLQAGVDVFALGVVLYQCLTGQPPFQADDAIALIAKILLQPPQPPSELNRDIPPPLEQLVLQMLEKDPQHRPADGAAVLQLLRAVPDPTGATPVPAVGLRPSEALTTRERRLVCMILAEGAGNSPNIEQLKKTAASLGGRLEPLVDGSVLVTLSGSGAATDLAAQAARIALGMMAIAPVPMALATGRGVMVATPLPVGDVLDRAARLLRRGNAPSGVALPTSEKTEAVPLSATGQLCSIRLDDVTAGLLDAGFEIGGDGEGLVLRGERPQVEAARTLLGKPTPCVARDAELAALQATYNHAVEERMARAVLVTAPAGVGKSRLRYELLKRLSGAEVLIGRGDPMSAGAPFVLLGAALKRAAGIFDGEPLSVRRTKLRARVGRHVHGDEGQRVAEFLGELIGTPFPDDDSVQLRAARGDAQLMSDQMRRAFLDWLDAESEVHPTVIVLEDLHWGDQPTVAFVDAALRTLRERPLFVLALARPEVELRFPRLWAEREVQSIRLGELGKKASERLVREVLGDRATDSLVARIVERAAGNAFYLEELVRAAAESRRDDDVALPETVLAMVQARLEAMEPEARQVLRAASVFGQVFWSGAVTALLGRDAETTSITRDWLAEVVRREVVTERRAGKFYGETEYTFRHALVRDAAYAMLTDADRELGHRLAAQWLERVGEPEALVLAEHFERGGERTRAVGWWRRAAEQALGGNDLGAALARVERGLVCIEGDSDAYGPLRLIQAEARNWRGEFPDAERAAMSAMNELGRGSDAWYAALGECALAAGVQGKSDVLASLLEALDGAGGELTNDRQVLAATRVAEQLIITGSAEQAGRLLGGLERLAAELREARPGLAGRILSALALRRRFAGDAGAAHKLADEGIACFDRAGDRRNALVQRGRIGYALLEIGDFAAAEKTLADVATQADRMGLSNVASTARHNLGLTLARLGRYAEARTVESSAAGEFSASGNRRMEGASLEYLALIELAAGDALAAEAAARGALQVASIEPALPLNQAESLAILGQTLLAQKRDVEALDVALRGMKMLEELGGIDDGEAIIRLTLAESLHKTGDTAAAHAAISSARDRLLLRAAKIVDDRLRQAFLEQVPENQKTLALAKNWLG